MKDFCFELVKGTDRTYKVGGLDSVGNQIRFGGYSAYIQVRASVHSTEAVDTLTVENGRIVLEPDDILWVLNFPNEVTKTYPVGRLVYDMKVKSNEGKIYSLLSGYIDVKAGVTDVM